MWRPRQLRGCSTRALVPAVSVVAIVLVVVALSAGGLLGGSPYNTTVFSSWFSNGSEDAPTSDVNADQLLDGLLTAEFSEQSCRSRYAFSGYYKKTSHRPSPFLLTKLRKHEVLQKRCGPGTAPYLAAVRQLKSGKGAAATDCRYLISISYSGLGNRMLAIVSAFLYAVITERVLLVNQYNQDVSSLFCEPFPGTTWLLPYDWSFPLWHLRNYGARSKESLGNMLKNNILSVGSDGSNTSWSDSDHRPPYVYLHLEGGYDFHDKLFYCDEHQRLLRGAPWLLMRTNSYLIPGLFLVPSFEQELSRMFPEKDTAFHHLGRYLFHPANDVWHAVTSYYDSHLADAGQRVGIQIRVFVEKPVPPQRVLDHVFSCVSREQLLTSKSKSKSKKNTSSDHQAMLVTSLSSWYYERIRDEYSWVVTGGVHQPSHEGRQKQGNTAHDAKALSEMYLLSMCDVLVTSGFSTFGYVAQGLGGVTPWIMPRTPAWFEEDNSQKKVAEEPPCVRAMSMEPCFHSPSFYDCVARKDVDVRKAVPYVRQCEDVSWGIKIVNGSTQ